MIGTADLEGETPPGSTELENPHDILTDDDGLMKLYESRLRRLRGYQSQVGYSRYNVGTDLALSPSQRLLEMYEQPRPASNPDVNPVVTPSGEALPGIISLDDEPEVDDDLTQSTGVVSTDIKSQLLGSQTLRDHTLISAPETFGHAESFESEESINGVEKDSPPSVKNDEEEENIPRWKKGIGETEYSTSSDAKNEEEAGYTFQAGSDSKYEQYNVLVDPDQDDRAVEIALYSNARPHMRGFHFAWFSFFVAFFTWFAMTPLLSEVQVSLDLSREEIWTSSTLAVAGSAVTRILIGPINDIYGARWTMSGTLLFSAIPTAIAGGAIQNAPSLYVVRLFIGVAGSAFVTCQFWTSTLFVAEVAGTANSLAAGWGNLGGGVAQIVMGSLLFPLFKIIYGGQGYGNAHQVHDDDTGREYDRAADLAWRTIMVFPALLCLAMAYFSIRQSDDSPKGNFRKRRAMGLLAVGSTKDAIRRGAWNFNTWLLFLQYGCCFGVEITMTNAAALYFQEEFGQNTETAAAIASIFGWMNLFARGIGGFCSDIAGAKCGMRGRLAIQLALLLGEGALVCLFSRTTTLATAIVVMVFFSIFVQAAEGSTFAVVPYVDFDVTGSIAGIVGAGGNVGGVVFSLLFLEFDNQAAFLQMGLLVLGSSLLTFLLRIKGHRSLLCGQDAPEVLARRENHTERMGNVPNLELMHTQGREEPHRSVVRDNDRMEISTTDIPVSPDLHAVAASTAPENEADISTCRESYRQNGECPQS